jgi:surface protein
MFHSCSNLATIDGINSWDTVNVTDMAGMFSGCESLTSLDLSSWNVCNVGYYGDFTDNGSIIQPNFGDSTKCNGGLPA